MRSPSCISATSALLEIRTLKEAFELAYDTARISGDEMEILKAKETKGILEKKIHALKEDVWRVESEDIFALSKQYASQKSFLRKIGILEVKYVKNDSGDEQVIHYINGVDKKEYPIPSLEDLRSAMLEDKELLMMKAEQGFIELLIVPFAMDLTKLIDHFEVYLKARNQDKKNHFYLNPEMPIEIDLRNPDDEVMDELMYHPKNMQAGSRGGETKEQILEARHSRNDWHQGFEFILVQKDIDGESIRSIPHEGGGSWKAIKSGRADIEAGKDANEYIQEMIATQVDPRSAYFGESGMTLEAWIAAFMTQLEERGTTLDTLSAGEASSRLTGAYFPRNDTFICAYWNSDDYNVVLAEEGSEAKDSVSGARMVVRI